MTSVSPSGTLPVTALRGGSDGDRGARLPLEPRPSALARAAGFAGDGFTMLAVIFTIPFVILLVGAPIVLVVQLGLWLWRML